MTIDEATIRDRCTEAVFERGRTYHAEARVQRIERFDDVVTAVVQGSMLYDVIVERNADSIDAAYDHYAKTMGSALDGCADCVLATDPSPEEFDTHAGVLEARASTEPPINNEQFWCALDDLEERYPE